MYRSGEEAHYLGSEWIQTMLAYVMELNKLVKFTQVGKQSFMSN